MIPFCIMSTKWPLLCSFNANASPDKQQFWFITYVLNANKVDNNDNNAYWLPVFKEVHILDRFSRSDSCRVYYSLNSIKKNCTLVYSTVVIIYFAPLTPMQVQTNSSFDSLHLLHILDRFSRSDSCRVYYSLNSIKKTVLLSILLLLSFTLLL